MFNAEEAVARIRAMHAPMNLGDGDTVCKWCCSEVGVCWSCGEYGPSDNCSCNSDYPCATIRTLEGLQ